MSTRRRLQAEQEVLAIYEELAARLAEDAYGHYLQANGLYLQIMASRKFLAAEIDAKPPGRWWQFWRWLPGLTAAKVAR